MSKLDQIDYETYTGVLPKNPDGTSKKITDRTREQIKKLFLELVGEDEQVDTYGDAGIMALYQGRNNVRAELRKKINNL